MGDAESLGSDPSAAGSDRAVVIEVCRSSYAVLKQLQDAEQGY
jgi:hypothetical protein